MLERVGQYKILERVGSGRLGDVYRARDTRTGRTVAVTFVADMVIGAADRRARFVRDARAGAALSHPNIAAIYDVGDAGGQLYLAREFVP